MVCKQKFPTTTALVEAVVRLKDDFMTSHEVLFEVNKMEMRGFDRNINQVLAALHHLRTNHVIGLVQERGQNWWYYTKEDMRMRTLDERSPEEKPRRKRVNKPRRLEIKKDQD